MRWRLERDRRAHQRASDHDQRRLASLSRPANYRPLSPSPLTPDYIDVSLPGGEVWPIKLPLRVPVVLHGSTKLAGVGRLWMMRCAPLISIVAQSVPMELILPPGEAPQQTGAFQAGQEGAPI